MLYEGGAVASFNLSGTLVPSAEYASHGALWGGGGAEAALSMSLLTMALASLLLGVALIYLGARFGLPEPESARRHACALTRRARLAWCVSCGRPARRRGHR